MSRPIADKSRHDVIADGSLHAASSMALPRRPAKRFIDVIVAGSGLLVLLPLLLLVALLVRVTSKGPSLFWATRVGRGGAHFLMPKFQTMRVNAPVKRREELADSAQYDTPIGRILRATSNDELPQLWSAFKGDMSLFGSRPVLPTDRTAIERQIKGFAVKVRPGITGLAQIRGRNGVAARKKARYDALYARRHAVWVDLAIKWKTALYALRRRDIL